MNGNYTLVVFELSSSLEPVSYCDCIPTNTSTPMAHPWPILFLAAFHLGPSELGIGSILYCYNGMAYVPFYCVPDAARIHMRDSLNLERRAAFIKQPNRTTNKKVYLGKFRIQLCYMIDGAVVFLFRNAGAHFSFKRFT